MKVKTLLISSAAFVIAFGIGLGGTLLVRGFAGNAGGTEGASQLSQATVSSPRTQGTELPSHSRPDISPAPAPGNEKPEIQLPDSNAGRPAESPAPVITEVDGPEFSVRKRTYSVRIHAEVPSEENPSLEYILYDDAGKMLQSGASPALVLAQCESGVYFVAAKDTVTGEVSEKYEIKGCRIRKMSAKRLEQICNSGDYTSMRNVEAYELSPEIELSFEGIPEDSKAASIDDICTRISFGIWKSVSINDIRYDELNLVEYVKFRVVI